MKQEKYAVDIDNTTQIYEFVSVGSKGSFQKLVQYTPLDENGTFFNLGFGDKDPVSGKVNDLTVTDNGDTQKVLATVADTVLHFTARYPDVWVFATGSTPARTRLYRMGITNHLNEIESQFEVLGLTNDGWQSFEIGMNYEAFLVKRKS